MKSAENQKTVLIADDADANRALLKKIFGSLYQIVEAEDGAEALALLRTLPKIDLVLLDIVMPQMDGYHVLKAMMADSSLCRIPVIVTTASGDVKTQIRAMDYGAADVVTKPYQPQIIQHRVNNILRRMDSERLAEQSRIFEQQLRLMETDEKTGLYNKRAFCGHVTQVLEQDPSGRYAILRWDIDRFRAFNEIYGMAAGDALLADMGKIYRTEVRSAQSVVIAGHWHADCFVTLRKMDTFDPERLMKRLDSHMAKLYPDFEFVTRAGVYVITDRKLNAALMCDRAMLALRSVKNSAQVRCGWYDETMRRSLLDEQEMSNEARAALTAGQFVVYFQPQYNYAEHALFGAEALVRWNHPRKGLIPPGRFIPLFEENGFISELDQYVWRQACICQRRWLDAGIRPVPISVNVSRQDIYHASLCSGLQKLLEEYRLPPDLLHLEITESAYMENPDQLVRVVHQLQGYGFHVEMDDFGSGYSSLNMLKDVAVDMLKLDMRFLSSSNEKARGGSILSAVVRMAHGIGLPVIAEGVETLQQANYLKSVGCLYMQGYLFAKPMDEESYSELLQRTAIAGPDLRFSAGVSGSTDFLSATTQSTLLFNSFVGGAAIVEYENGEVQTLRVNDKFLEILNLSYDDYAEGRSNLLKLLPWKFHAPLLDMIKTAIHSGQEAACEVSLRPRHIDGEEERWLRVRARFLAKQATGDLLYMAIDDISMRMNLLRHNEQLSQRLSDVMRNLPGAVYHYEIREKSMRTVYFNDMAASMFGYEREEYARLFAEDATLAVCPEDRAKMHSDIQQAIAQKLPLLHARYRHACKDGGWRWVSVTGSLSRREGGTLYASAILMDIQAEVESEALNACQAAELERQRGLLQQLYSTIPCGIVRFFREKGCLRLESLNDAARQMFGFAGQEEYLAAVQKHGQFCAVYPEDRAKLEKDLGSVCAEDEHFLCDYRIQRTDGSIRWMHALIWKVAEQDGRDTLQIVFTDVTDPKGAAQPAQENPKPQQAAACRIHAGRKVYRLAGGLDNADAAVQARRIAEDTALRLHEMIRGFPGGLLVYQGTPSPQLWFANDRACEMFGFTREEYASAVANGETSYFPPELAALATEEPSKQRIFSRLQMTRKDGSRFWLQAACRYEKKADGLLCCMALMDVSDSVRAEQVMQARWQEMEAVLRVAPGGFFRYSAEEDQQFSFVSDGMLEIVGYTREEFLQRFHNRFPEMICADDRARAGREIRAQLCKGEVTACEYRVETHSGEQKWVHDASRRIVDEKGRKWFVSMIVDIDRYKRLEQEQQAEKQRAEAACGGRDELHKLLRALPAGIASLSYRDGKWAMATANDTLCRSIGCLREAVAGASAAQVHGLLHPDDAAQVDTALEKLFSEHHSARFECRVLNCNTSRYVWLLCEGVSLLQPDGSQTGYLVCSDIQDWTGAVAASHRQTAYLETLYELLPCGVSEMDADWNLTFMNRAGRLLLGENALPQSVKIYEKILPEDRAGITKVLKKARTLDMPQTFEGRILYEDKVRWLNGVLRRTADADGREVYLTIYHDVTEIKTAQMQMEKLIEHLPGGVGLYQMENGRLLRKFCNRGMRNLLEYLQEDTISEDIQACVEQHVCAEDRPKVLRSLRESMAQKQAISCTFRILLQDGSRRWIELAAVPLETPDGTLEFCGVCSDISARKAEEEEEHRRRIAELHRFREEMRYLEAAQDENMIGKARYNLTRQQMESCNVPGLPALRQAEKEGGVQMLLQLAGSASLPEEQAALKKMLDRKQILENFAEGKRCQELEYRRKDGLGRGFWAKMILKTYKDPESGDIKSFLYMYNVNEKKTLQAVIDRISEIRFELLGVVDLQTGFLHCYRHTDFEEQLHCGMEMLYQTASESFISHFIIAEERAAARQALCLENICAYLENKNIFSCLFTAEKEGGRFRKQWSFLYLDESRTSVVVARTDMTSLLAQQDRQQKQLRGALQQVQEASRSKTEFLSNISHEMRTPMNAIIGLTELASDRAQDEVFVRKAMRQVTASSGLLLRQINDLLDMSSLQSETIHLEQVPCRLPMLLAQLEMILRPQCTQKQISLKWETLHGESAQREVMADPVRFQQIFFNLLSNAVKFTNEGGSVRFSVREVAYTPEQVRISATVTDTGIGMGEAFQQRLFEPFAREHTQEQGEIEGMGLGLSIAKQIIDHMRGTIAVKSAPDEGTTFTVELPFALCRMQKETSGGRFALPEHDAALLAGKHVLLVDDNRINLDIAKALLQKQKMLVDCAENGKDALAAYAASPEGYYAVILMDIRMPVMDGPAAVRAIRKLPRRDAGLTPVIAISANALPEEQKKTRAAGIDDLLAKPIQPMQLYGKMIELLENGRAGR